MDTGLTYVEGMFKNNTGLVTRATEGIPAEQWLMKPGDCSNDLLWVVGHLIWARTSLLKTIGSEMAIPWTPKFARGVPAGKAEDLPSCDEVRKAWLEVSDKVGTSLPAVPQETLDKPHGQPTFDGKVGGFLAFLAFHETYHVGQVSYLRKWLGHGQLLG
jgi:uncharacterized damage-inducible protein DinB